MADLGEFLNLKASGPLRVVAARNTSNCYRFASLIVTESVSGNAEHMTSISWSWEMSLRRAHCAWLIGQKYTQQRSMDF